jgi:hypothetical protein
VVAVASALLLVEVDKAKCATCGNTRDRAEPRVRLHRCSACQLPRYCSKECQRTGWNGLGPDLDHKQVCRVLAQS